MTRSAHLSDTYRPAYADTVPTSVLENMRLVPVIRATHALTNPARCRPGVARKLLPFAQS